MADQNAERDPLELLAAEYMQRLRQGQCPSVDEYASTHPELAEEIRELFPTIALTERLKSQQTRSCSGRVALGAAQLDRLGDFRILREIGRGGMGVVFEAEQESLARRVAVKVLPRQVLLDEKHLKRFQREARIAANLHHTNIVEVFGVGEENGFHYYVMQYIQGVGLDSVVRQLGKTLRSQVQAEAPLPLAAGAHPEDAVTAAAVRQLLEADDYRLGPGYWRGVARIGWQAADALSYAHGQGVLHRDVKPGNLLLGGHCDVWLTDFGLAKAAQSDDLSLSKDIVGTLRYMAPEQFRSQADHRSDIYSLGLTLYELLALHPAYQENDQSRLIQRILDGPPPTPGTMTAGIPRDLETIVLKAISHDAGQRYQSASEMAEDLRNYLEDRPIRARRASPLERLGRWGRRNKALAALAGISLMLLVSVAVVASVGYLRTKRALAGEALERANAEANASLAIEALDRTFERLYPARMTVRSQPTIDGTAGIMIDVPSAPVLSKETAALLEEMLPFYDRLAQQTGNTRDLRFRTAEANRRVGAIRQRLGQSEEAVKAYERAAALLCQLTADASLSHSNTTLKVTQIQNELGRLFTSRRQAVEARQAHRAALALLEASVEVSASDPAVRFELARTCFFLGLPERPLPSAARRERRGPEPISSERRDSMNRAVMLLRQLSTTAAPNPEYQHLLALCYLEGAQVDEGRRGDGRGGNERGIEILEGLVKAFPGIPDYSYDLSEAYARLHIPEPPILPEMEAVVVERFSKALALLDSLVIKHPDIPDFLASQARLHHKLGAFHRQMDRWQEAEGSFRKAMALQHLLVAQFPESPYYTVWMATFRMALADALMRREQPGEAVSELQGAIADLSLQAKRQPRAASLHERLAAAYGQLELALRLTGQASLADEAARQAKQERALARPSP